GFPDGVITLDKNTERVLPWEQNCTLTIGDFSDDENLKNACPRTVLKSVIKKYHELGLYPKVGFELEWYNFKKEEGVLENPSKYSLTNGMFGYSLNRLDEQQPYVQQLLKDIIAFNVPIEGFHTETGPGVYEASIQYGDALEAADHAALLRYAVKSIAVQNNVIASFMAKWNADLPGSGGHVHVSLQDKAGNNLLKYKKGEDVSDISAHFLSGILEGCQPLFALYAPTINSYKRLTTGSWAATTLSWGFQNRTTAIRVVGDNVAKSHLEIRMPGADANPYLTLAATLAAGLYGIKQKLSLKQKELKGNAYNQNSGISLPRSLEEAVLLMKTSSLAKELISEGFFKHFIMSREWEIEQHRKAVTDWEIKRYLEII
ncbi:UNVERIFIED_CONTAM: hypothetical protein GTU68_048313, partial [Idotea baltica]|nr:hypothetical protein [Idotea baltica]